MNVPAVTMSPVGTSTAMVRPCARRSRVQRSDPFGAYCASAAVVMPFTPTGPCPKSTTVPSTAATVRLPALSTAIACAVSGLGLPNPFHQLAVGDPGEPGSEVVVGAADATITTLE